MLVPISSVKSLHVRMDFLNATQCYLLCVNVCLSMYVLDKCPKSPTSVIVVHIWLVLTVM